TAVFGTGPKEFTGRASFLDVQHRLWDNLIANLFAASSPGLVTVACKYLGTLHLIELLARGEAAEKSPGAAYRLRPLVPKWLVTLASAVDLEPDEGVADQSPVRGEAVSKLKQDFARF